MAFRHQYCNNLLLLQATNKTMVYSNELHLPTDGMTVVVSTATRGCTTLHVNLTLCTADLARSDTWSTQQNEI